MPRQTIAQPQTDSLPDLRLPRGFRVEAGLRFPRFRTDSLALQGDSVFWLDHRNSTITAGTGIYHRIERLNLRTLRVETVLETKAPLTLFTVWAHGLVMVTEPASHRGGCTAPCVRPVVAALDLRRPAEAPRVIARADSQPLGEVALTLQSWRPGILFQSVQRGRTVLQAWRWRTGAISTLRTDRVGSSGFSVVGDVLVGQRFGSRGLWAVSLNKRERSVPPLPATARTDGLLGATVGPRLIWSEPGRGATNRAYESTLRNGRFGPPRKLFDGDIYVLENWGGCRLVLRNPSGLFAINTCTNATSTARLLTAHQSNDIYNPGRFALQPGRFAFALTPGLTKGQETLVILKVTNTA